MQWEHWARQGDITEEVWNDTLSKPAEEWVAHLRELPKNLFEIPPFTAAEFEFGSNRIKSGKAAGADGLPPEAILRLSCLNAVMPLLCNIICKFCVYPTAWGASLVRALLKPGKPADQATSLRGIRLICSMASWMGQVLDQRLRGAWEAGTEQFGFRAGVGCMEACAVLLALVYSRIHTGRRVYVLWIDLRTAFPSLNRGILVRRLFECGVSLGLCRLLLAIFDLSYAVPCIGRLVGHKIAEQLGVREGAVESPHLFNLYVSPLRQRLLDLHPRQCQMLHMTVAVLMYADDAALPAYTIEDLRLSARMFEDFATITIFSYPCPKHS